eukprot:11186289-Alexandrium_andersonii.AAC.1
MELRRRRSTASYTRRCRTPGSALRRTTQAEVQQLRQALQRMDSVLRCIMEHIANTDERAGGYVG